LPKTGAGAPKTGAFETYRRAETPNFLEISANQGNSGVRKFDRN
jgi:hypothetical protein